MVVAVQQLRDARKSPSVLRMKVIKIRGVSPDVYVMIHEGVDDIPVYETWLSRLGFNLTYEAIHGSGKQQLLEFHSLLQSNSDPLAKNVYFFVDRDFDEKVSLHSAIYELPCYSIENALVCPDAVQSLLRDEFRCSGSIAERAMVVHKFLEVRDNFRRHAESINFRIFVAVKLGLKIESKPELGTDFVRVLLSEAKSLNIDPCQLVKLDAEPTAPVMGSLKTNFDSLPAEIKSRGKYELDMFRKWLRILAEDRKNRTPSLFSETGKVAGEPATAPMRRYASACKIPSGLSDFVAGIKMTA